MSQGRTNRVSERRERMTGGSLGSSHPFPSPVARFVPSFFLHSPRLRLGTRGEETVGNRTRRDPKGRMEEEIIGNRWKELDYDGYYLSRLLPPFIPLVSSRRLVPFRLRRPKGGEWNRRRHDPTGGKKERKGQETR